MKYVMSFVAALVLIGVGFDFYLTRIHLPQENTLTSVYQKTLPAIDGTMEEVWQKAAPLRIALQSGTNRVAHEVEMRSLHNDLYVSFLLQWQDDAASLQRQPWLRQKDNNKHIWQKQASARYDENRFGEDKLAILWPVKGSIFANNGCASTCHTAAAGKAYGAKYAPGKELLDLWQWGSVSTNPLAAMDDMFLDSQQASPRNFNGGLKYDFFFNKKKKNRVPQEISAQQWLAVRGWSQNQNKQNDAPFYFPLSSTLASDKSTAADGEFSLGPTAEDKNILMRNVATADADKMGGLVLGGLVYRKDFAPTIKAKGKFIDGRWTLEIQRLRITDDPADLQMRPQSHHYLFSIAVFNNALLRHAYSERVYRLAFAAPAANTQNQKSR